MNRNDLANTMPTSAGTCTVAGQVVNLDIYRDQAALQEAVAVATSAGCAVGRAKRVRDFSWVAGPNWVASTTSLTVALELVRRDRVAELHTVHC